MSSLPPTVPSITSIQFRCLISSVSVAVSSVSVTVSSVSVAVSSVSVTVSSVSVALLFLFTPQVRILYSRSTIIILHRRHIGNL